MELIVYNNETNEHVATITGNDPAACIAAAEERYGYDDGHSWTYSPAWGMVGGLVRNPDAIELTA